MSRTTTADVRCILPNGTTLTDSQILAAIDAATCLVDQCTAGQTAACLKQIETYLAAHYAAATENALSVTSETDACCGGEATYGFQFGEGVKGTPFGQTANMLSRGCLAEFDKQPVDLFSIGSH